jgi:hypothetical protein
MATVEFRYDPKNTAWFTANAAMVLKAGEPAYHDTTGLFKLGDGVTALSALSFLPTVSASTPTIQQVLTAGQVATTTIETTGFIKTGGTSAQFLKADGTVDSNVYGVGNALTTNPLSQFAATTSSQLAGVISDETGSGSLVFGTSPTFTTSIFSPLVNGASTASGTLTLASTTNATKGTIQIGTTDLVNIGNKTTTSQRLVRIGQDTAWVDIGSLGGGGSANGAIYFNQTTPGLPNSALWGNASATNLNVQSGGNINVKFNNTDLVTMYGTLTGVNLPNFLITLPSMSTVTTTANSPSFRVTGANKQWATGALATQYFNHFTANTVSFVGASTATLAANFVSDYVQGGTNATITTNTAIHVRTLALTNTTYGTGMYIVAPTGATTNTAAKFLQNNGQVDIGSIAAGYSTIWMGQATPSGSNYTILMTGSTACVLHASATVGLSQNQGTHSLILGSGILTFSDTTLNCVFGSTNGTKLGTSTSQKISFWNAVPIVQPTTAVASATVVSGAGGTVKHDDTFDGYTLEKVVRALRTIGLLA